MKHPVLLAVYLLFLMSLGVAGLLYPQKCLHLNERLKGKWIRPMPTLMGPRLEIWSTRIAGAGFILMALFLGYLFWVNR